MTRRRVVVAPDSFKGTATAIEVAAAIAEGWREVRPDDDVVAMPMADGGEGALDAFAIARPDARRMPVTVTGPDDRVVEAYWLWLPGEGGESGGAGGRGGAGASGEPGGQSGAGGADVSGGQSDPGDGGGAGGRGGALDGGGRGHDVRGGVGVVELANTSGITLLDPLRPLEAHTLGFGQAIRAALAAGVDRLVLAIGGSSSTDGGAGALSVLGASFTGADGGQIQPGNGGLGGIARADFSTLADLPPGGASVLSDVTNPLLGRLGAVAVFGPQKGIGDGLAPLAEANLENFARVVTDARGTDPETPGAGAAGGAGFGLLAWGATLTAGASAVGDEIGLPAQVAGADIVVTGEGRYDHQSESGKVPSYVRSLAAASGARSAIVAGLLQDAPRGFDAAVSLTELAGSGEAAMGETVVWLREAGRRLARELG
ncbi:glycerate kinase [Herbiconiux daphne]|uniref:Glycerate kinase n=1 Tax=Herbiconiux daphne TaxID=2970914 RepID=A0ABT2H351_9MICO|nr:glycerate kinase [Herbiconiux daphne]MCS5734347.1 glycerate kinase [Herbiconiux daphne]